MSVYSNRSIVCGAINVRLYKQLGDHQYNRQYTERCQSQLPAHPQPRFLQLIQIWKSSFFFILKFKSNLSNKLSVNNTCDAKRTHFVVSVLTTCRLLLLVCKCKVVPAVNFALGWFDRLIRVQFKTEKLKCCQCWKQMLLPASKKFNLPLMRLDLMIPGLKGQCSAYWVYMSSAS